MIKVAFFHSDLEIGGQQRSLVELLKVLDPSLFDITLFYFRGGPLLIEIPSYVRCVLIKSSALTHYLPYSFARKSIRFREVVDSGKFDIAIDYSSYFVECAIGVDTCKANSKVVWIHTDLMKKHKHEFKYRISWLLSKRKFKLYQHAVCVSKGAAEAFREITEFDSNQIHVFPNIVDVTKIRERAAEDAVVKIPIETTNYVFLGRLAKVKRVDKLLRYFEEASKKRNDIRLFIIGEGPELLPLKNQVRKMKAKDSITFCGSLDNPYPTITMMDCLVLISEYEGQGIVVQEAKALGLNILVSKNLEKYNQDVQGVTNIPEALIMGQKRIRCEIGLSKERQGLSPVSLFGMIAKTKHENSDFQHSKCSR